MNLGVSLLTLTSKETVAFDSLSKVNSIPSFKFAIAYVVVSSPLTTVTSLPSSPCRVVPSGTVSDTLVVAFSSLEVFSTEIVYLII